MRPQPVFSSDAIEIFESEPRVLDLRLGEVLGFDRPRDIRKIIERHAEALENLGRVCATVAQTSEHGGRPATAYYLTEEQCVYICAKSETPRAVAVTLEVVRAFVAMRRAAEKPTREIGADLKARMDLVRDARMNFGVTAARQVWAKLGLPALTAKDGSSDPVAADYWRGALRHLLLTPPGDARISFVEILREALQTEDPDRRDLASKWLGQRGVSTEALVDDILFISNSSEWADNHFNRTPWAAGWRVALRAAPGVRRVSGISIPIAVIRDFLTTEARS